MEHAATAAQGIQVARTNRHPWTAEDIPEQRGRSVVVTGANSGLGFLTSLELARRGAHVIMTARNMDKGRSAEARIRALQPTGSVELRALDLSDLDQVRAFGERLMADGCAVDVLVNNAGIMMPPHPGYAATHLQSSGPSGLLKLFMRFGNRFLAQPAEMGVLPQLFAATAPGVESGQFIGPDGKNEKTGHPRRVQPVDRARDADLARLLWQESERLTGVHFDLQPR